MIRVIAPHLDDAVLSLGQYLIGEPGVVHTVFAGIPEPFGRLTPYDKACGFPTSTTAMQERREEDKRALKVLGSISRPMGFLDLQYRHDEPADVNAITDAISGLIDPDIHLFAPLGIGHPDHRLLSKCVRLACPPEIIAYEELPYRVLHPEEVFAALDEIAAEGWEIDALPFPMPQGPRPIKEAALRCYRSQIPDGPLDPCFLVPERAWRLTR